MLSPRPACSQVAPAGSLRPAAETPLYRTVPLTSYTGIEYQPALSADGKQLAFAWRGEPPDRLGIYVKLVNGGAPPLRISPAGKAGGYPTWSPDGARVAYVRPDSGETDILVAPALGGPERRVARYHGSQSAISWSPDGKWIAASVPDATGSRSLQLASIEAGEFQSITHAPAGMQDISPRFSPDGTAVAFVRITGTFNSLPFWVRIGPGGIPAGAPRQIGSRHWYAYSLDWFPDGKSIVLPVVAGAVRQYWKLPIAGGNPVRLPLEFQDDVTTASPGIIALRGTRLVTAVFNSQNDIGRLEWDDTAGKFQPAGFFNSSRTDEEPQVSPNGQWVVLSSTRSGSRELWRAKPDGSQALLLTSLPDLRIGSPRWSFDSQWIAFDAGVEGTTQIYVIGAEGGKARQVTSGPDGHTRPSFSSDGKWIYFSAGRGQRVERIPFGGGAAEAVTTHGSEAFESPDGRWLYYAQLGVAVAGGIFRMPAGGGAEQLIIRDPRVTAWELAGNHVYVGITPAEDSEHILRIDPDSGKREEIYRFPAEARRFGFATSLTVSRDERTIYHAGEKRAEADILLIENFR